MKHYFSLKFIALFVVFLSFADFAMGGVRGTDEARRAASRFVAGGNMMAAQARSANSDMKLVYSSKKNNAVTPDDAYYYVFSTGKDKGYTIVSGDDRMPEIIGYTLSGDYDAASIPENMRSFMQAYQDFIDNATDEQIAEITSWKSQGVKHAAVQPFLDSQWNQGEPYNDKCPVVNNARCVTGCVATAVAQVLYYHGRYADISLTDNIPAYNTKSYNIYMPAVSAGQHYDWGNMLPSYGGGESQVQKDAVAKLMLHVGCAVQMDYSPSGSGANATASMFVKYFGMDPELIRQPQREDFTIAEWDAMLYDEMAALRPVYYDGQSTGGGHAFVIQGYSDGLYYVNWGWGGYCDGYFDVTILNPHSTSGAGSSSSDDGYSMRNSMITGIQPDNGVEDILPGSAFTCYEFGNNRLSGLRMSMGRATASASPQICNFNPKEYKRYVSIGYKNADGNIINAGYEVQNTIKAFPVTGSYSVYTFPINISFPAENGKIYELFAIESEDGAYWMEMDGSATRRAYVKVDNGTATLVTPERKLTAALSLDSSSGGYAGMGNKVNVTIENAGQVEYYDLVYIMAGTSETMPSGYTFAQGITAPAGGSTTFDFAYTPQTAGKHNFWVLDKDKNVIGRSSITFEESTPPVLSFVSIKCTNASGDKTCAGYLGHDVEMYKVYDTKADFSFEIRNDGGFYEGQFAIFDRLDASTGHLSGKYITLSVPGHATTKFTFTVEGNVGDVVFCLLQGRNYPIADLSEPNIHYLSSGSGYYAFGFGEICYLAGVSSVIDSPITDSNVDTEPRVIYNVNGQRMQAPRKGINIINGRKVIVR